MFQSISISFNSFSIVFNNTNFSIFFSINHKQQYFTFIFGKNHTHSALLMVAMSQRIIKAQVFKWEKKGPINISKKNLKFQKMLCVMLKFSKNTPKKMLFYLRSKRTNYLISRKLCQRRPNGNPGTSSERFRNMCCIYFDMFFLIIRTKFY